MSILLSNSKISILVSFSYSFSSTNYIISLYLGCQACYCGANSHCDTWGENEGGKSGEKRSEREGGASILLKLLP